MESFGKSLANIFRNVMWYMDYGIYKALHWRKKKLPENVKKILVVELLFIGDMIVTTPTLRALKKHFPKAKISMMVLPVMKEVLSGNPNIDKLIPYSKEEIKEKFNDIAFDLRGENYDLAVILHPGSWMISRLLRRAEIPFRMGCTRVGFLEGKGFFLNYKTKPTFEWKHKLEDNLDVVRTIGVDTKDKHLEIYTTPKSDKFIKNYLKKNKIKKYAVIHASPQHKSHEWSAERFADLADKISRKYKLKVLFTGGEKDYDYNRKIINLMEGKGYNVAGSTIKEFFSIVKFSEFVVSVDTSAMHVAAGLNKPVVALFGAGNPRIWYPFCKKSEVLFKEDVAHTSCMKHECKFSGERHMECMNAITIDDVLGAIKKVKK